ncbi:MAG: hypothetical protein PHP06_08130 [Clostridia bacterium]|nr:hypothetical protein [Clostridia bacterium]
MLYNDIILKTTQVISISDAFDAMCSYRSYSRAKSLPEAVKELLKHAGSQFDPELIQDFIKKAPDFYRLMQKR